VWASHLATDRAENSPEAAVPAGLPLGPEEFKVMRTSCLGQCQSCKHHRLEPTAGKLSSIDFYARRREVTQCASHDVCYRHLDRVPPGLANDWSPNDDYPPNTRRWILCRHRCRRCPVESEARQIASLEQGRPSDQALDLFHGAGSLSFRSAPSRLRASTHGLEKSPDGTCRG
jgi:hypothetical protein